MYYSKYMENKKKGSFMRKYCAQHLVFKKLYPQIKNPLMSQPKCINIPSVAQLPVRAIPDFQFV